MLAEPTSIEGSSRVSNSVRITSVPRNSSSSRSQKIRGGGDQVLEIKDLEDVVPKQELERLNLTSFDMWALGISIVIGGQYFAWNAGLHAGFGSLLISTFLMASGYLALVLCIAELSSALPFAGGSYGIARVTLGFFPGFLVAYIDCAESIVYVATSTYLLGQMITSLSGADKSLEPVYWTVFFVTSIMIHSAGGLAFWWLNRVLAIVSLVILLIYILGSIHRADFQENALFDADSEVDRWFSGGGTAFMRLLPLPCWFFVGVESINLACKDMIAPKISVPRGYAACILTLLVTCFGVLFVCCSLPPGITVLKDSLNPLNYGFAAIFKISYSAATGLSLPATYTTASGFMFCFGRQLRAMGQSGLTNHVLGETLPGLTTPVYALTAGSAIAFGVCFVVQKYPLVDTQLFNICMLCAFTSYGSQFVSFVILRTRFATIKREFVSPLGIAGAVYGFVVFTLPVIAICGFQENFIAIITFIAFIVVVSLYYIFVAQERQFFSDEEKDVMFRAYVMKNNGTRASRLRKGHTLSARVVSKRASNRSTSSQATPSSRSWVVKLWTNSTSQIVPTEGSTETAGARRTSTGSFRGSVLSSSEGDSEWGDVGSEPGSLPPDWENATAAVHTPERSMRLFLSAITEKETEEQIEPHHSPLGSGRVHDFFA